LARLSPYIRKFIRWFIAEIGSLGMVLVQFLLTVGISAILYSNGETAAAGVRRFAHRLAGARGENAASLAAQAIRAVSLGVVVTALVQALLAGLGLAITGVPYAATLTAVIFILGVAQLGPMPVLVPAVIWMYWKNGPLWGTLLLVWSVPVAALDNFLRPILIRRGADLPLLLIFAGVIGGLIAFGIIGLFIGPVVLAVSYTLLTAWITDSPGASAPQPPDDRQPQIRES
jgi:predicted PurR-regulated permease PerM